MHHPTVGSETVGVFMILVAAAAIFASIRYARLRERLSPANPSSVISWGGLVAPFIFMALVVTGLGAAFIVLGFHP